jgi:hypothetical protein
LVHHQWLAVRLQLAVGMERQKVDLESKVFSVLKPACQEQVHLAEGCRAMVRAMQQELLR